MLWTSDSTWMLIYTIVLAVCTLAWACIPA